MKERSLQRLSNIDARFGSLIRDAEASRAGEVESFRRAFEQVRDTVIVPVLREMSEALEARGFRCRVEVADEPAPQVTLRVFLRSARPDGHRVVFEVIDRGLGPQVLVFLEASPPVTDLARYQPADLTRDVVEQVVVDALEHIFAFVAELR
jgi:hypothetical protein